MLLQWGAVSRSLRRTGGASLLWRSSSGLLVGEPEYSSSDGRRLSMTWVRGLMDSMARRARLGGSERARVPPLPREVLLRLLASSRDQLSKYSSVVNLRLPPRSILNVCGDTHGQYFDLLSILSPDVGDWPSPQNAYLFNGDFVDRGLYSIEVVLSLLCLKLAEPDAVHLLRGNHETTEMNAVYGFEKQVQDVYGAGSGVLESFRDVFDALPLAAVVEDAALVVHGGLGPVSSGMTLAQLAQLDRFAFDWGAGAGTHESSTEGAAISEAFTAINELLWADPGKQTTKRPLSDAGQKRGFSHNKSRGGGQRFGPDVTHRFLKQNGLGLLVRSHEPRDDGFSVDHDFTHEQDEEGAGEDNHAAAPGVIWAPRRCMTVFSAPNYCDNSGNLGAFVRFNRWTESAETGPSGPLLDRAGVSVLYGGRLRDSDVEYSVVRFAAVPHPHSSPVALEILKKQHETWARRRR